MDWRCQTYFKKSLDASFPQRLNYNRHQWCIFAEYILHLGVNHTCRSQQSQKECTLAWHAYMSWVMIETCGFDPWVAKIPWRRKWQPTPVFLPGESIDRGAWWAPVDGVTKSWTWLSTHTETNDPMLLEDGSLSWRGSLSAIHVADSLEVKFSERGLKTTLPSYTDSE